MYGEISYGRLSAQVFQITIDEKSLHSQMALPIFFLSMDRISTLTIKRIDAIVKVNQSGSMSDAYQMSQYF